MSQYGGHGGHGGQKNSPWARGPQGGPPGGLDGQGILGFSGGQSGPMFQGGPHNVHPGLAGIAPLGHPAGVSLGGNQQFGRALNVGQLIQQQHPAVQAALQQHPQHPQAQMGPPFGQNLEFRLPTMGQGSQQQQQQQQGQPSGGQTSSHNPAQKVFTGTVTKLLENFGFVDEDVFFQTSVVKGPLPQVNDRVLVEAAYNANMPFKWNATRIQVMSNGRQGAGPNPASQAQSHGLTSTTTLNTQVFNSSSMISNKPSNHGSMNEHYSSAFGAGSRGLGGSSVSRQSNSPVRNITGSGRPDKPSDRGGPRRGIGGGGTSSRDDRRVDRSRDRSRDRDRGGKGFSPATMPSRKRSRSPVRRSKSRSPRRGSVSPSKSKSPPRRRARTGLRYIVSIPKVFLNFSESNILTLKQRYSHMYIPSDFFLANHSCNVSFPIHDPFKITQPSSFHVLSKEYVVNPSKFTAILDPADADHTLNVKVMLMASPSFDDFVSKTCFLAGESSSVRNNLVPPGKMIQFLVGTKGKNETSAIGGPWSPSLDGPNPLSNPAALIRTAIRTCKALTGIDLSNCTQWRRFLDVNYRRQESGSKPAKTETTVIFLPDVWSIMPTEAEYDSTKEIYKKSMECKLNPSQTSKKSEESVDVEVDLINKEGKVELKIVDTPNVNAETANDSKGATNADVKVETSDVKMESNEETEMESDEGITKVGEGTRNPTPWRELDLKTIKVPELKEELAARGLDDKGLKSQLLARLQKTIRLEQEKEEQEALRLAVAEEERQMDKNEEKEEFDDYLTIDEQVTEIQDGDEKLEPEIKQEEKKIEDRKIPPPPPPPLTDKQISSIKAAFKLPQQPTILVHPNPKAKSGKFDCTVVSLSSMLDYRVDDNKEGTFEVSLFAELFNEMLIRDAGFKVYKAVVDNQSFKEEKEKQEEKEKEKEKQIQLEKEREKEKQTEMEKDKIIETEKENDNLPEKDKEIEAEKLAEPLNVDHESKDKDNESSKSKKVEKNEKAKVEKKTVTVHKDLLSAFSFFDTNHCGYLEAKDLEEILFVVGPTLSRAYIKKIVSKVTTTTATKETQVHYRAFTDLPVDAVESVMENKESESMETLSVGFRAFLQSGAKEQPSNDDSDEGVVTFKGSVVDVGQLLAQLSRSEKSRADSERRLAETTKKLNEMKDASEKLTVGKEKLQTELRDLKGRLKSTDEDRSKSKNDNKKYLATIKEIYGKIGALIADENEREKLKVEEEAAAAAINGTEN